MKLLDWWFNHYKRSSCAEAQTVTALSVTGLDWTCWDTPVFTSNRDSTIVQLITCHAFTHTHTHAHEDVLSTLQLFHSTVEWPSETHIFRQRKSERPKKNRNIFECHDILNMVLQQHTTLSILEEKQNVHTILRAPHLTYSRTWGIYRFSFLFFFFCRCFSAPNIEERWQRRRKVINQ